VRISSPPVKWPCFYGIDFATRAELIATGLGIEEIRASIGADSLGYIAEEDMIGATGQEPGQLCLACFNGEYPIPLPDDELLGKHLLEQSLPIAEAPARMDAEGVPTGVSGGGFGALNQP
jgi:amidophosphoribosyltransferase